MGRGQLIMKQGESPPAAGRHAVKQQFKSFDVALGALGALVWLGAGPRVPLPTLGMKHSLPPSPDGAGSRHKGLIGGITNDRKARIN